MGTTSTSTATTRTTDIATTSTTTTVTSTRLTLLPTPVPTPFPLTAHVPLHVSGLDYSQLMANSDLLGLFNTSVKEAVTSAAGLGVTHGHVQLVLSQVSDVVAVNATVVTPDGVALADLEGTLWHARFVLSEDVAGRVNNLSGIELVSSGPIA